MRSATLLVVTALLALSARGQEAAPGELLGPILGHVGPDRALVWVRTRPTTHAAQVRVDGGPARTLPLQPRGRGFAVLEVDGLQPDRETALEVTCPGGPQGTVWFRSAPLPRAAGKVRFGVGSCAGFEEQPIWDALLKARPELFLWLGDSVYLRRRAAGGADWDSIDRMLEVHLRNRARPNLLACMQRMACYAVWDDHDFGPNDCDRHFPLVAESRLVWRYLWANPAWGEDEQGVYFSFRRGPVEFFVLDGRSFKDVRDEVPEAQRQTFGPRQLAWLRRGLLASQAPLKVIAAGSLLLVDYPFVEGWQQARQERQAFLDWLGTVPELGPVLFLSGDIHVSELSRTPLPGGRTGVELTSSGLAQQNPFAEGFAMARRPGRVWLAPEQNFCLVEVNVAEDGSGTVTFRCLAADGEELFATELPLAELGVTKRD